MGDARGRTIDALEVAGLTAIVVADAYGLVPITQTLPLVPLIWLALRIRSEPWRLIGWRRPSHLWRTVLVGAVAGIAMELLAVQVTTPCISAFFGVEPTGVRAHLLRPVSGSRLEPLTP